MEDFRLIYDFQAERSLIGAMLIAPEKVIPEAACPYPLTGFLPRLMPSGVFRLCRIFQAGKAH